MCWSLSVRVRWRFEEECILPLSLANYSEPECHSNLGKLGTPLQPVLYQLYFPNEKIKKCSFI